MILSILFAGGYLFYNFNNNTKKEHYKTLHIKDLEPKSFIRLFSERYNKNSNLNFVTLSGDFPDKWVKPNDVEYLISIMYSKQKCCGYMNTFSSFISSEDAEIGGFAIIFLNSYISQTKINLGLNSNPKVDVASIKKIEKWYKNSMLLKPQQ